MKSVSISGAFIDKLSAYQKNEFDSHLQNLGIFRNSLHTVDYLIECEKQSIFKK
jgi:hypothetical protein